MTPFTRLAAGSIVAAASAFALATSVAADDYKWPRLLVIGTPGTSSGSFASTNGWAPVLQKEAGVTVRVVPEDSETQRYRRLTERGDINLSSVSSAEMRYQVEGIGGYAGANPAPMRILWHHNDTPWSFVVAGDSDIQSIEDITKGGVRITQGIFSPAMTATVANSLPRFVGMTPEEAQEKITYVPASSYVENCRSVVEGKSDIAYCSPISSVLSEMEGAPGGIRWLDLPMDNTEGWAAYLGDRPMLVPTEITFGVKTAHGVEGATSNFLYAVPADADEDLAYNLVKWMHESFDDYKDTHPLASRMSLEQFRAYLDRTPLPVHPGTVKYLKEIGEWSEEDEANNQKAIETMDIWIAARQAALDEARENRVTPDFQNEEYLEIFNKHTEGLEGLRSRL